MTLTTEERAAVVAAVLSSGERAPRVLERLNAKCVDEARRLLSLSREERVRRIVGEVRKLFADPSLNGVHESWLAEAASEPVSVRRALAEGASPVAKWLRRRLFGYLVPMSELPEALRIEAALESLGRRWLEIASLAVSGARGDVSREEISAAVRALAGLTGESNELLFFRAGARFVGPVLDGDAPRQIAQRLPKRLGMIVLEEACEGRLEEKECGRRRRMWETALMGAGQTL